MKDSFYERKTGFSQTYFLSRVVKDAKRPPKVSFFIRKNGLNPLRWTEPSALTLQIFGLTPLPATLRALARLLVPGLSSCGSFSGSPLCHCGWYRTSRKHSVLDPQRPDPTDPGSFRLSSSRHFEDFSVALQSKGTSKSQSGARPTPSPLLPTIGPALQCHHRCRYPSADHLWVSRRYGGGLHPQKTPWPSFLRTDHLQRGQKWFELGDGTQGRQRARLLWRLGFPGVDPGETSFFDCCQPHPGAARWSLLRQKDCRIPGCKKAGLRHRCQNVPTVEEPHGPSSIPRFFPRLASSRVYLDSFQLESRAPICSCAKACSSGARRDPETAFHLQELHLPPSFGHQLGADSRGGVAFVLRPSLPRTFAPRVQGCLCHGQDSHPQLLGQRYLHGDTPVGLRLGSGFPVSVFAQRSAALEYLHAAPRALVVACRMGQTWAQKYPLAPSTLPAARSFPQDPTGYFQSQASHLNRFATFLAVSSLVGDEN